MQWILQNGFSSEHRWNEFVSILERQEYEFSLHSVEPFVGQIKPEPIVTQERVICIGSYSMRHVAKQMDWQPGVFDLYEQNFLRQKEKWGSYLLNFESTVSTVCKSQFSQEKMFIRPIHDSKYFSGRLFTQREFEEWKQLICEDKLPNQGSLKSSTEILVGRPQEIFSEFRFWVVNGNIVTQSLYKRGKQIFYDSNVDSRIIDFVRERIAEWQPHEAFVIDVCETSQGPRIVELNTINSSAFYAANLQLLVNALAEVRLSNH